MTRSGTPTTAPTQLSNRLVVLMAVATGTIVANLYYSQPLLHQISTSFRVGTARWSSPAPRRAMRSGSSSSCPWAICGRGAP